MARKARRQILEVADDPRTRGLPQAVRLQRGEVELQPNAPIPLVPDDPASAVRPGRRARVVWTPDKLLEAGSIGRAEYQAASRYRDDWETAAMPRTAARSAVWVPTSHRPGLPVSEARERAVRAWGEARGALAPGQVAIAEACILGNGSITAFAATRDWSVSYASGYLRGTLEQLAAHYSRRR